MRPIFDRRRETGGGSVQCSPSKCSAGAALRRWSLMKRRIVKRERPRRAWVLMQLTLNDVNALRARRGERPLVMADVHHLTWFELCRDHLWPLQAASESDRRLACG